MTTPTGNALTDANAAAALQTPVTGSGGGLTPQQLSTVGSGLSGTITTNDCIWPGGTRDIGLGLHAPCVFSYGEARAVLAVAIIVGGLGVLAFGTAMFAVIGALPAVGGAAEGAGAAATVLGAPEVGAPLAAMGADARRSGAKGVAQGAAKRSTTRRREQDRNDERQYDEVMARRRDSAKGPAVRDRESVPF